MDPSQSTENRLRTTAVSQSESNGSKQVLTDEEIELLERTKITPSLLDYIDKFKLPYMNDVSCYEKLHKIGHGKFGEVFKARCKKTGTMVTLKKIEMEDEGFPITALREIKMLQQLKHQYITEFIEICSSKYGNLHKETAAFYLVFTFCEYDLAGLLSNKNVRLTLTHCKTLMKHLLSGLHQIHNSSIVHRNMKPANVLITRDGVLKLTDFGLEKFNLKDHNLLDNDRIRTLWYRPPELLLGERECGPAVDIWATGCIMAELWTREPIMQGYTEQHQLQLISQLCGSIVPEVWPEVDSLPLYREMKLPRNLNRVVITWLGSIMKCSTAVNLIVRLLTLNPAKRITAEEALNHAFFFTAPQANEDVRDLMAEIYDGKVECARREEKEKFDSMEESIVFPMSYEEKKRLSVRLFENRGHCQRGGRVVQLIQKCEGLKGNLNGFSINFETLKTSTLRKLKTFVDACIKKENTQRMRKKDKLALLSLPNEIISHVFTFLPIKDRLRARVNKKLNAIESNTKYFVDDLRLIERSAYEVDDDWKLANSQYFIFSKKKTYSSDCMRRITQNASIGNLEIRLTGSAKFHREVYDMIKDFENVKDLKINFKNHELAKEIITDSFILDFARKCTMIDICGCGDISDNISPDTLHQIYKSMVDGSIDLCEFYLDINKKLCKPFFDLIEINFRDDQFFSDRDIEEYERHDHLDASSDEESEGSNDDDGEDWWTDDEEERERENDALMNEDDDEEDDDESVDCFPITHIFDGNMEIMLAFNMFECNDFDYFHLVKHDTPQSLDTAKKWKALVRIDHLP